MVRGKLESKIELEPASVEGTGKGKVEMAPRPLTWESKTAIMYKNVCFITKTLQTSWKCESTNHLKKEKHQTNKKNPSAILTKMNQKHQTQKKKKKVHLI